MDNLIETINYKGYDIQVLYDTNAESPDAWGNDDCFLVYDHRDFNVKVDGFEPLDIFHKFSEGFKTYKGYWIFPVSAYIHGGVSLSLSKTEYPFTDKFDVSFKGFVLVQKQAKWTWKKEQATIVAEALIEQWNLYLSGQVYGYCTELDSCWGFYGDDGEDEMIREAKQVIDSKIEETLKAHFQQLKAYIRNKVPLYNRNQLDLINI